ncbi:MAG: M14 family metallopeptidase [Acidobacteria bacterium]|nr:M14 family metallopeptidase [Acidobacteriota bacterium]
MRTPPLPLPLLAVALSMAPAALAAPPDQSRPAADLTTPAEACAYRCTPGYRETIEFLTKLARSSRLVHLSMYGETAEGYPMPMVVAAREMRFTPEAARASGLPVVLVFSGIHAGEIDGKDASLALLRDIVSGKRAGLLDNLILVVVPIYNVDGHERVSPSNRLAQDGPAEGMGFRTNGRGLDLNRDFVKMESPETAALVGRLFRDFRPHVVVDCHVTDGMDFQYEMTYFAGESPNAPAPLRRYVAGMKEAIGKGLAATGHAAAPFGDLENPADPNQGVRMWAPSPRYSTSYFETRNRVSLLAEAHAYKPFAVRVAATYEMLRSILEHVAADPKGLTGAVAASEAESARRATAERGATFGLAFKATDDRVMVDYLGWSFDVVPSEVTGRLRVVWSRRPETFRVPLYASLVATKEVRVPRGYLLSRAYAPLAAKAVLHGLRVSRTLADADLDVEVFRATELAWAAGSYQGHHAAEAKGAWAVERRHVPSGTFWIPLDQPDAPIAMWLFEPESPEGFLAWNAFDNILERKMVVEDPVVERMAAEMLKDQRVRADYERAFPGGAGAAPRDPNEADAAAERRLMWFYARSPFFDREVGVYPIARVTSDPGLRTAEWTPPAAP